MKKETTTPAIEICKHCGGKYTVKERIRVYGNNPFMQGYCSAGCYTEGVMKSATTHAIPVKDGVKVYHNILKQELTVVADEKGPAYTGNEFKDNEISLSHAITEYNNGNLTPVKDVDSQEFYEIAYAYRFAEITDQGNVTSKFEALKQWVKDYAKADNERLLAENDDLKKYVDYAAAKISFGSMPYTYENWVDVGKPDYE